jgi:molybdopterin/thiamine biosynthesis adenylyltransferase
MNPMENFYDRLRRQPNWDLDRMEAFQLVLVGNGRGVTGTLALAAASCGVRNLALCGSPDQRGFLQAVAFQVMEHLGPEAMSFIPVYAGVFIGLRPDDNSVWIIDAGDGRNDNVKPRCGQALYYAECRQRGEEFVAVGTDRKAVAADRTGSSVPDRAEIPMLCSQLLIGALAQMGVCDEIDPLPQYCRIPLSKMPKRLDETQSLCSSTLHAGGGGAISHQELWAESLDPILKRVNNSPQRHIIVVDPGSIHESCRSRQWGYTRESCGQFKAHCTARWIKTTLFPEARVTYIRGRLNREHFHHYRVAEVFSSIDNWSGRKVLSRLADGYGIPWWSAGSSFFGGFARQVSQQNPWCASADEGVERLRDRPEDDATPGTSCSSPETPVPSSVLPQMILASFIAAQRRQLLAGSADLRVLARGIEVHLAHGSTAAGYEGLRWSPGRWLNMRNPV